MKRLKTIAQMAVLVAVLSPVSLALGEEAFFMGLGDLPGGVFDSRAAGVSDDGSVVVGFSESATGLQAFRWTESDGMVGLGELPGGLSQSRAADISGDGLVIVGDSRSSSGREAYRWTESEGMVGLGDLPGGPFQSGAYGVNSNGSVIVGTANLPAGTEAFRWTEQTGMVALGDLPGGAHSGLATAVTDDGAVVVGRASSANSGAGRYEAFRWTQGTGLVALGDLPGGDFDGHAWGISADGSVIVGFSSSTASGSGSYEVFRWTQATGMVGLGDLPGGAYFSEAFGISADGSVIVGKSETALGEEAFIWDEFHGMRNFGDLLVTDLGLDLTGWTLTRANEITPDGQTIVGWGINPDGDTEAWIAHIFDACPDSDLNDTIVIDGCDADVANLMLDDGCTMADRIAQCAEDASNHGDFVSCVAHLTNEWKHSGLISGHEKGRIHRCAAQADIPTEPGVPPMPAVGLSPVQAPPVAAPRGLGAPAVPTPDEGQ
jgi:probable HAF family extracellular repeat protein